MNNNVTPIKVGKRYIGDGHPIFFMADVGLTHGGDFERVFRLIDAAAEAGADCIKFQMIGPDVLLGDQSIIHTYSTAKGKVTEKLYDLFKRLEYSPEQWQKIAEYARQVGLEFVCTSHYMGAVPILEEIGVDIHKICTWSMSHKRLVQALGATGKPFMLDTGMFTSASLLEVLDWHSMAGGAGAVILHDFHTANFEEMNFKAIPYMKSLTGCPVGYTPQSADNDLDYMSIGLGANILEKRLTLDTQIHEIGHSKALDCNAFEAWVTRCKQLETALGRYTVTPTKDDVSVSSWAFKSLWSKKDIKKGELITDEMLDGRRPGDGISVRLVDDVCTKVAVRDIPKGTKLSWEDLS